MSRFRNRMHAGELLARRLQNWHGRDALVLALPRGGVPVGYMIAHALGIALDVLLVRKLGVPGHEEYAMGAIASGGGQWLQTRVIADLQVPQQAIDEVVRRERQEIARREKLYRGKRPAPVLAGRIVILVDDGLATGATMKVAVQMVRKANPARIVVAVPVAPPDACAALAADVDELVCLQQPVPFRSVGQWYDDFGQTGDDEVMRLLAAAGGAINT